MTAKESLYSIIAPIFSDNFFQGVHPDVNGPLTEDFGVYTQVGGTVYNHLRGQSSFRKHRFQISVYSLDCDRRDELVGFVEAAMSLANDVANTAIDLGQDPFDTVGAQPNLQLGIATDGYEDDTKYFFSHLDFYCWKPV